MNRYRGGVQHTVRQSTAGPVFALAPVAIAALVTGCGVGSGMIAPMPEPTSATAPAEPVPRHPDGESHLITITGQQRAYLNAVREAGLQPSEDLVALSIGSYVCQARAARLSEQAMWEFVYPLVRNDIGDTHSAALVPSRADVTAATAEYIRIASEQLC
ncbi:Uncharacterised protein [Mycolicibacterium thermoresistibile]|uniref:DUF732 domain-containing protein n=1 Tax=Mycolicibacterium thermoresistibile TaxID=1797 RepID=A0A100XJG2_MYCTH|nr:putative uncharacterized protein [Mycolicibacterium thermoresistibile]SNW20537.1 Uncharacterised protein [Mycolicibacterium thermoresistibile]